MNKYALIGFIYCVCSALNRQILTNYFIDEYCSFVQYNIDGFGVGVYAGKDFQPLSLLEIAIGIHVPRNATNWNELENYVDGISKTHDLILLGNAMLYNHAPAHEGLMISKSNIEGLPGRMTFRKSLGLSVDKAIVTNFAIFQGDQIFSYYGDEWFKSRNILELETRKQMNREVLHVDQIFNGKGRIPGCPTEYMVYQNNVLRAAIDIPKGTIIEVSRALLLPESIPLLQSGALSTILWWHPRLMQIDETYIHELHERKINKTGTYILYEKNVRYTLLLLGFGALYSPANDNESNVVYKWWNSKSGKSNMISLQGNSSRASKSHTSKKTKIQTGRRELMVGDNGDAHDEINSSISKKYHKGKKIKKVTKKRRSNSKKCSTQMMVSFTSKRDIVKDEILNIDLSEDPRTGFRIIGNEKFFNYCI